MVMSSFDVSLPLSLPPKARADLAETGTDLVQVQTRLYETELALAAVKLQLAEADSRCEVRERVGGEGRE